MKKKVVHSDFFAKNCVSTVFDCVSTVFHCVSLKHSFLQKIHCDITRTFIISLSTTHIKSSRSKTVKHQANTSWDFLKNRAGNIFLGENQKCSKSPEMLRKVFFCYYTVAGRVALVALSCQSRGNFHRCKINDSI